MELIRSLVSLRALIAVQEAGSFAGAAAGLGVTQSAISQHVAALERSAGLRLVEPRLRPVELTPAGLVLAAHGRAIAERLTAAEHDLSELKDARSTRIRLGGFPSALATFLPEAIARLRRTEAGLSLTVVDDHMQRLWPRLDRRELDVAIVFDLGAPDPALPDGFDLTPLFTDHYRLLLPPGHRLLGRPGVPAVRDLAGETWIGGAPASTWFRAVRDACAAAGFVPRVSLISDDYLAVQAFVRAGLGIAVVPGLAAVRRLPGTESLALRGAAPQRRISVAHVAGPYVPRAVTTFVDLLPGVVRGWVRD